MKSMCDSNDSFGFESLSTNNQEIEDINDFSQELNSQIHPQIPEIILPPNSTILDNLCYSKVYIYTNYSLLLFSNLFHFYYYFSIVLILFIKMKV